MSGITDLSEACLWLGLHMSSSLTPRMSNCWPRLTLLEQKPIVSLGHLFRV